MSSRQWILAYDIQNPNTRQQCLRALRADAMGYQKSVFEIHAKHAPYDVLVEKLTPGDALLAIRTLPIRHAWQLGRGAMSPANDSLLIQ